MDNNRFKEVNKGKLIDKDELIETLKQVSDNPFGLDIKVAKLEATINLLDDIKKDLHSIKNIILFFLILFLIGLFLLLLGLA